MKYGMKYSFACGGILISSKLINLNQGRLLILRRMQIVYLAYRSYTGMWIYFAKKNLLNSNTLQKYRIYFAKKNCLILWGMQIASQRIVAISNERP